MDAALITGATAIATGIIGYLAARLQHRGELARVQVERDRLGLERTRAAAERATIEAQHLEEQRERRRSLYFDFLEAAEKAWSLGLREEPVRASDLDSWWIQYQNVRRRVVIGSAIEVVTAHEDVNNALVAFYNDVAAVIEEEPGVRHDVWVRHHEEVESAIGRLQQAMRTDLDVE